MPETRRKFIQAAAAFAAGDASGVLPCSARDIQSQAALRDHAAPKGILYGTAVTNSSLLSDTDYASLVARQAAILTHQGAMKWDMLRPARDSFDFRAADWFMTFAAQNGQLVRGHTLVWHHALPAWFASVRAGEASGLLTGHIRTVLGRYAGRIHSWDVVNEVIDPAGLGDGGLRRSPWLNLLGPEHIPLAFETAHASDPHALLVWNENDMEAATSSGAAKRDAWYRQVSGLKSRQIPIHAVGFQGHLSEAPVAGREVQQLVRAFGGLGLKVFVTELDVFDQRMPADRVVREKLVAEKYSEFLSIALSEPNVALVTTWGLSARYTFLTQYQPPFTRLPVRPLPYDEALRPTAAWTALAEAFDKTYSR